MRLVQCGRTINLLNLLPDGGFGLNEVESEVGEATCQASTDTVVLGGRKREVEDEEGEEEFVDHALLLIGICLFVLILIL